MGTLRDYWNKIFWGFFIVIGIGFIALAFLGSLIFLDLLFGFVVIAMGIHKLQEEFSTETLKADHEMAKYNINNMSRWMTDSHRFLNDLQRDHDTKFSHLNEFKTKAEEAMEDNYRDLVKKIVHLENRLNEISRAFLTEKPRSGRKRE